MFVALLLVGQAKITTPRPGSSERNAILAAIRPYAFKPSAVRRKLLNVRYVRTDGTAAVVRCAPTEPDEVGKTDRFNVTGDLSTFFLRKGSNRWRLLGSVSDFHEGGVVSVYDLRPLKALRFPMRLLKDSDDPGHATAAGGNYLFGFDEKFKPMKITPAQADALAGAGTNPKFEGRYAQINRFRKA